MPLTEDQKAMLRLLAQREQGYEDIGSLMGLSVEEVREKVKEALDELSREGMSAVDAGPAPEPPPPPEPQPAQPPPPEPVPQEKPAAGIERPAASPRPSRPPSARRPQFSVPPERRRLVALAGGALALVAVVLVAIFAIDGGSSSGGSASVETSEAAAAGNRRITQAILVPADGGEAQGRAVFGRVGQQAVLQVQAEGLEPSPSGKSYAIWLYRSPKLALRVGSVKAPSGGIATQLQLPTELVSVVAGGAFKKIYLSLTSDAAYKAELARAKKQQRLPAYTGTTVLRGEINGPLVRG